MKKLALAGIVSILAMVALSGCMSVPKEEETTAPTDKTTPVVEETPVATETTEKEEDKGAYKYESNYGFELTFPASWGTVKETIDAGDLSKVKITLTSENGDKKMNLYAVGNGYEGDAYVLDVPSEKLGVGQSYTIYREVNQGTSIPKAQGEDVTEEKALENEQNQIAATFKTVEQEEGGGGIAADESADNYPPAPGLK